ncbi:hypothetical protein TNIN_137061 [Trichonephila inaurata madagascariensis]|uniref:Uncharacterized protein n=1 Tax=Trichonephila inaurata madagascariensis TaxID=2747483 RepID=A0A8X6Y4G3_9ARAC|nr:hypothetical protein TNIN_137061 [Trichonephila inaurata madagascariensis]
MDYLLPPSFLQPPIDYTETWNTSFDVREKVRKARRCITSLRFRINLCSSMQSLPMRIGYYYRSSLGTRSGVFNVRKKQKDYIRVAGLYVITHYNTSY